jgi:hypothetical protein
MTEKNYVLGRGKVYFARFKTGTYEPDGFKYFGNTPAFSLNIQAQMLDHYSSEQGIRDKDESVPLEVNRTATLTTDNIIPENVALFFFGSSSTVTQAVVASAPETLTSIKADASYKLGTSPTDPIGLFGISKVGFAVATTIGATPLVSGVDYTMDFDAGIITFLQGSTIAVNGVSIDVTYAVLGSKRDRVISGTSPVEGALIFRTLNPQGKDCTYVMPYVKVNPNGDYALKGDTWQELPLTIEVLTPPTGGAAITRDGMPAYS